MHIPRAYALLTVSNSQKDSAWIDKFSLQMQASLVFADRFAPEYRRVHAHDTLCVCVMLQECINHVGEGAIQVTN